MRSSCSLPAFASGEQFLVGHARPDEKAEPRGERQVGQRRDRVAGGNGIEAEGKVRRHEDAHQRCPHGRLDALVRIAAKVRVELLDLAQLRLGQRPAIRPLGERLQSFK